MTGVLPLTLVKTKLFGARLVSNAFCVEAGPLAEDHSSLTALEQAAISLMHEVGVPVLEFRNYAEARSHWPALKDVYVYFRREIEGSADANLRAIPRKQRAMVRKGIQNGLRSELDTGVDRLSGSMRRAFKISGRRFFRNGTFAYYEKFSGTVRIL